MAATEKKPVASNTSSESGFDDSTKHEPVVESEISTLSGDVIRFDIDDKWELNQLSTFLATIEDIYQIFFLLNTFQEEREKHIRYPALSVNYSEIEQKLKFVFGKKSKKVELFDLPSKILNSRLKIFEKEEVYAYSFSRKDYFFRVIQLKYNSPGNIDLLGVGKAVEMLKDFCLELIKVIQDAKLKKIELKLKEEELKKAKIENMNRIFELAKEMQLDGISLHELYEYVEEKQEKIINLIDKSQLKNVQVIENNLQVKN